MRKITKEAIAAFYQGDTFSKGNTSVEIDADTWKLRLHGHCIARLDSHGVSINPQGYMTNVTKERLNGLNGVTIVQKNWTWYLNGKLLDMDNWTLIA